MLCSAVSIVVVSFQNTTIFCHCIGSCYVRNGFGARRLICLALGKHWSNSRTRHQGGLGLVHIVIGTDFLRRNPQVKKLSLQRPYSLHCDFGSWLFSVPLELSGQKESGLRYASKTNYRTENYQLARHALENGLAALQVNLDEIQVELFASQQQHIMQLYCSKQLKNAFRFFWKAMGLVYANPPFSLLAKVLTKIIYEGGGVVMCTPDWRCSGEHAYWRRMLD